MKKNQHDVVRFRLRIDGDAWRKKVEELVGLLRALPALGEVPQSLIRLAGRLDQFAELVSPDFDHRPTAGAGETTIVLKPGERLCRLVSALRAGERDLDRVLEFHEAQVSQESGGGETGQACSTAPSPPPDEQPEVA